MTLRLEIDPAADFGYRFVDDQQDPAMLLDRELALDPTVGEPKEGTIRGVVGNDGRTTAEIYSAGSWHPWSHDTVGILIWLPTDHYNAGDLVLVPGANAGDPYTFWRADQEVEHNTIAPGEPNAPAGWTMIGAAAAAPVTPPPWTDLTLQNGFTAFGNGFETPQYRIVDDEVELRGVVKANGQTGHQTVAAVPATFAAAHMLPTVASSDGLNTILGRVHAKDGGNIIWVNSSAAGFVSLDGITVAVVTP